MYDKKTKRRQFIIRTTVSVLMTSAVLTISVILLFLMLGYRFNRAEGSITQGGLVQFISTPPGAQVTVGTAQLANVTPSKITLAPGTYPVEMKRKGYHVWNKTITIGGGTVTWLNTARLVPTTLTPKAMAEYPNIQSMAFSARARFAAIIQDATKPVITLDAIDQVTVKSAQLEIPPTAYTAGTAHSFSIEFWGSAEQYILVKHVYDEKTEWIVVDTASVARSKAISAINGIAPMYVTFDHRNSGSVVALYADGTMRHIQPQTGEIKQYPLQNIALFSYLNDQTIMYATKSVNGVVSTGYYTLDASSPRPLKSYKTTSQVYVAGSEYFSQYYLSVAHESEITILSSDSLPRSDSTEKWLATPLKTITLRGPAQNLVSHANGRLIVATHGSSQSTYDLELSKQSTIDISRANSIISTPLNWVDDFNLISSYGGILHMSEFDGANQHDLGSVIEGMPAIISDNNKYLYTVSKSTNGISLYVTKMVLE